MKHTYKVSDLGVEGVSVLSENEDSQSLFYSTAQFWLNVLLYSKFWLNVLLYSITTSCFLTAVSFNREFDIRTQTAYKREKPELNIIYTCWIAI